MFHRDLGLGRLIPPASFGPRSVGLIRRLPIPPPTVPDDMLIEDVQAPGAVGDPDVRLRIYRPRSLAGPAPVLIWIHGGGQLFGLPEQDDHICIAFARTLGITVVSVDYRYSPDNPAPSSLDDCYAGLAWIVREAAVRGFDVERVAVGGASAGGGLAAGLTLMAHDRGEFATMFQLLVYPMLDDRTALRTDIDTRGMRVWMPASNEYGWRSYLGSVFGTDDVSEYAAPARRVDLGGLPPAWIGVGSLDLFHDEDLEYARRLGEAGVPCETVVVDGAFHGFDMFFRRKQVTREFWRHQARALQRAFYPDLDDAARL